MMASRTDGGATTPPTNLGREQFAIVYSPPADAVDA